MKNIKIVNEHSVINEMIKTVNQNESIKKESQKLLQVKTDFSRVKKVENLSNSNESISL